MNLKDVMSKEIDSDTQWVFKKNEPEGSKMRSLIAKVIEIAIRTSFSDHIYTFGGDIFHQTRGGPIESRLTMMCARLVMSWWVERAKDQMRKAEMDIWLSGVYVDNLRFLVSLLGSGWSEEAGELCWNSDDEDLDGEEERKIIKKYKSQLIPEDSTKIGENDEHDCDMESNDCPPLPSDEKCGDYLRIGDEKDSEMAEINCPPLSTLNNYKEQLK